LISGTESALRSVAPSSVNDHWSDEKPRLTPVPRSCTEVSPRWLKTAFVEVFSSERLAARAVSGSRIGRQSAGSSRGKIRRMDILKMIVREGRLPKTAAGAFGTDAPAGN